MAYPGWSHPRTRSFYFCKARRPSAAGASQRGTCRAAESQTPGLRAERVATFRCLRTRCKQLHSPTDNKLASLAVSKKYLCCFARFQCVRLPPSFLCCPKRAGQHMGPGAGTHWFLPQQDSCKTVRASPASHNKSRTLRNTTFSSRGMLGHVQYSTKSTFCLMLVPEQRGHPHVTSNGARNAGPNAR